ncbi:MAG: 3-phosphoshikimate 1-carboxyvinyltransferase [Candidatus Omnitrophota bacterium]
MPEKLFDLKVEKTPHLRGALEAPASKSYTIRAILAASLNGKVRIVNPLFSQDTQAAIKALEALGARIRKKQGLLQVRGFQGRPSLKDQGIVVGESGTLLRLILPIIALGKGEFKINGRGTLLKRPNKPIVEALLSLGVDIKGKGQNSHLPITIHGKGAIPGGKVAVSANMSSQTISSLLMVSAFALQDTTIIIKDKVVSRPYIDITLDVLKRAGVKIQRRGYGRFFVKSGQGFKLKKDFIIHGDYSSAAFLIAASCLIKSDVIITDMVKDRQGDRKIVDILNKMGARIKHSGDRIEIRGPFELKGIDVDCSDTPDLVPILLTVSCFAKGRTRIYNIGHLAYKESNRITAPAGELRKLGARIKIDRDKIIVQESSLRPQAVVSSCNDHRIAMALAVLGLRTGGLIIKNSECINKSYPDFIRDLKALGAKFTKILP